MEAANYKYAGYWPRMWAYNVDLLILLTVYYLTSLLISEDRLMYYVCFLITWFYHGLFESSTWQATPGKRIMKLKAINDDGTRLSMAKGLLRFLMKIVSLIILYVGFIMIGFSKTGQGLHDRIVGSFIVIDD